MTHEDGVAAVSRLGNERETTALVAQLITLGTHIHQYDGCNKPHITVRKQISNEPGCKLKDVSHQTKSLYAKSWNILADATRRRCASQSTKSEHTYSITSGIKWCASQMKRHARPYRHHTSEAQSATQGIDTDGGVSMIDASYRLHQLGVTSIETIRHDWQRSQHTN